MDAEEAAPWERQSDESSEAFDAFVAYRDMAPSPSGTSSRRWERALSSVKTEQEGTDSLQKLPHCSAA